MPQDLSMFSLEGKTALVTGANTGLGQGICTAYAAAGANVIGVARRSCQETAEKISAVGGCFTEIIADLSDMQAIPQIVEEAHRAHDRIDILVNNAGIIKRCDAAKVTAEDWDAVTDLNEKMVFFLSQAFAKNWIQDNKGGKIINIASMLSYQGGIRVPAYTASKSAVMGLTRALANEWAPHRINVNAIAPGYMATNNTRNLRSDASRNDDILSRIPACRRRTSQAQRSSSPPMPHPMCTDSHWRWTAAGWHDDSTSRHGDLHAKTQTVYVHCLGFCNLSQNP